MVRCVWCDHLLEESDQLQMAYTTCEDHLVPLPTE